jgi:salicylate hydroxylase
MMARRGEVDETIDTGEAAYRVILTRSQMENDPELKQLIDDPVAIRWMGPDAHIVSYPIKAHKAYNIVTTHITGAEDIPEDWTNKASKATMQARFSNYAPIVTKVCCMRLNSSRRRSLTVIVVPPQLFALAPSDELVEWKLRIHLPLTSWIDNRVALLGDSAHATLPVSCFSPLITCFRRRDVAIYSTHLGARH